ncbi:unnamed protein product, partial [Iphiclides podalirius]
MWKSAAQPAEAESAGAVIRPLPSVVKRFYFKQTHVGHKHSTTTLAVAAAAVLRRRDAHLLLQSYEIDLTLSPSE